MIFLALGSNLPGPWGTPPQTLDRSLTVLASLGVKVSARSHWYRTAPYGGLPQSDYVNGVISVSTHRSPSALMRLCHQVEAEAGRRRGVRWGSRTLDIDLLAYHDVVRGKSSRRTWTARNRTVRPLILPHPEIAQRPFVLIPLAEIAPGWHHPGTGLTPRQMLKRRGLAGGGEILELVE